MRGDRLKQLREQHGYTHTELSNLLGLGYAAINRYEAGRSKPSGEVVSRISQFFNVSSDYLLGLTDDPSSSVRVDNLSPTEKRLLDALRHGDTVGAIKIIVNEEAKAM